MDDTFTLTETSPGDRPDTQVVAITGRMTIQNGAEIKAALVRAMESGKHLLLDLEQVTEIDLIGLQCICATHRAVMGTGRQLTVMKSGSRAIATAMQEAGYTRHTGCAQDTDHTCVWAEGGR